FTETWLKGAIPNSALHLPGFQLFRADRVTESSGKTKGGGLCFYINEGWCTDVTVLKEMCCPYLEALFINCKPFYSLLEARQSVLAEDEVGLWKCATIDLMSDEEDGIVGGVSGWIVRPPSFHSQELTERRD
ncbi:hypothetical protein DPX16_19531, partial [Anabarilius grahami]